ncbi:MAG: sensor histidine kinase [Faecousia sp.]
MRHSIAVKFVLILLTALCLTSALGSAAAILVMTQYDLYNTDLPERQEQWLSDVGYWLSYQKAQAYASRELGNCSEEILEYSGLNYIFSEPEGYNFTDSNWHLKLTLNGETLLEEGAEDMEEGFTFSYHIDTSYLTASRTGKDSGWTTSVYEDGQWVDYWLDYEPTPPYTAYVYLDATVLEGTSYELLGNMYAYRYTFVWTLIISLVLAAMGIVTLCLCAGQTAEGTINPGGLNRLPLDLYALADAGILTGLAYVAVGLVRWVDNNIHLAFLSLLALTVLLAAVVVVGYIFALAAQIKAKRGFWWRNSAVGFCLRRIYLGCKWVLRGLCSLAGMLPVIWQWLLTALLLAFLTLLAFVEVISRYGNGLWLLLALAADLFMVAYSGYALGVLLSGAKEMTKGNLNRKINTKYLIGSFREFAQQLNSLSETAMVAAQKQMKSERMKSELITNVSHDIKTPLTSIVNFVDLLQKPHTEEQEKEYLEVLARQSGRMKKLIEDLIEMSKANTGNITVNPEKLDAVETINQALGEFADKLAMARLQPVFHQPEQPVYIQADGRLAWRVLSNVLSNAVKYALPDTRLYIDLAKQDGEVLLSVKNISREEIRVTADELMERFVQGDISRNTEGSGLGLNIARSLMEVQRGQLNLLLDGDLFKVTLVFPAT